MSTSRDSGRTPEQLTEQVRFLQAEISQLRQRLSDAPAHSRGLELRLADTQRSLAQVTSQNERLAQTLREARDQITRLKEEVDRLAQPPAGFGTFLQRNDDDTVDVFTGGRKLRVSASPAVPLDSLRRGQEVMLNEALNVVAALDFEEVGEVVMFKELLADGTRALVIGNADDERVVRLAERRCARSSCVRATAADGVNARLCLRAIPKAEVEELVLEEVPDIAYDDIGGLIRPDRADPRRGRVAVPAQGPVRSTSCKPPKGVLLYGPPGCGKTLIAKAVANSLAKKVAEVRAGLPGARVLPEHQGPRTAQQVRRRDRAAHPADLPARSREGVARARRSSCSSTRWTRSSAPAARGVSSDVENTDRAAAAQRDRRRRGLENVIVIGASNREDMIDPAILRPGRLDVKIKIERPDAEAARDIFSKYLTADLPLHTDDLAEFGRGRPARVPAMIDASVERMYSEPTTTGSSRSPTPTATRRSSTSRTSTPGR
jgi:proteasome-associated ATPase